MILALSLLFTNLKLDFFQYANFYTIPAYNKYNIIKNLVQIKFQASFILELCISKIPTTALDTPVKSIKIY